MDSCYLQLPRRRVHAHVLHNEKLLSAYSVCVCNDLHCSEPAEIPTKCVS